MPVILAVQGQIPDGIGQKRLSRAVGKNPEPLGKIPERAPSPVPVRCRDGLEPIWFRLKENRSKDRQNL
jgi:hypothetical protein